jgi:hypothetical protein
MPRDAADLQDALLSFCRTGDKVDKSSFLSLSLMHRPIRPGESAHIDLAAALSIDQTSVPFIFSEAKCSTFATRLPQILQSTGWPLDE